MPVLETPRLRVRPMTPSDADAVARLHTAIEWVDPEQSPAEQGERSRAYVDWLSRNHLELAHLDQPPLGDRAVELQESGAFVGLCGIVPYIERLGVIPGLGEPDAGATAEVGIMWAIHPDHQGRGYATEVGRALLDYLLGELGMARVIATTASDNAPSQRVMEKLGMQLYRSDGDPVPEWLRVLGVARRDCR